MSLPALNEIAIDHLYRQELTCILGYKQVRFETSNHGGGISICIKDNTRFKHRNDVPSNGLEAVCIEVDLPKAKSFFVLAWYRPPSDAIQTFDKWKQYSLT